jgi:hypothetical protein
MQRSLLFTIAFLLGACGASSAQQREFALREKDNSCSRFPMKIVAPKGGVNYTMRVVELSKAIDEMPVINPCKDQTASIALAPPFKFRDEPKTLPFFSFGSNDATHFDFGTKRSSDHRFYVPSPPKSLLPNGKPK